MAENQITREAVQAAYDELSKLAKDEYGESLAKLLAEDEPVQGDEYDNFETRDSRDAFWRVGRLIGITVKEPFATAEDIADQPTQTGALRAWHLNYDVLETEHPDLWQYNLLTALLAKTDHTGDLDWLPSRDDPEAYQVLRFLDDTQSERGLFAVLVMAARPYLCKDPRVREQLDEALTKGAIEADQIQIVANLATSSAGGLIVAAIPWLGPAAAPFVAGIILLMVAKGLNSFCSRTLPSPTGGIVET